jgi:hypothetical protein
VAEAPVHLDIQLGLEPHPGENGIVRWRLGEESNPGSAPQKPSAAELPTTLGGETVNEWSRTSLTFH